MDIVTASSEELEQLSYDELAHFALTLNLQVKEHITREQLLRSVHESTVKS